MVPPPPPPPEYFSESETFETEEVEEEEETEYDSNMESFGIALYDFEGTHDEDLSFRVSFWFIIYFYFSLSEFSLFIFDFDKITVVIFCEGILFTF